MSSPTKHRFWLSHGIILLALALLLSGCGFHLRGQSVASDGVLQGTVVIEGVDNFSSFGRIVREMFVGDGVTLVEDPSQASLIVQLQQPRERREVLSVDSSVHASEYSLVSQLNYRLKQNGESISQKEQTLSVRRDLVVDPNDLLGSDDEANRLREDMARELVQTLLFRLRMTKN